MGRAVARGSEIAATEADFRDALAIIEGIGRDDPAQWDWRVLTVHWHVSRCNAAANRGDADGALDWAERGARFAAGEFPSPLADPHAREASLTSRMHYAMRLGMAGRHAQAAEEFDRAAHAASEAGDEDTRLQALQFAADSRASVQR